MRTAAWWMAAGLWLAAGSTAVQATEEVHFTVDTARSTPELKVGDKGVLSMVINPGPGKKVHDQAPLSIALKPGKGVTLAKAKLGHADVANKGAKSPEFTVEVTATAPGAQTTEAEMQFFICTDKWCERMQHRVTITTTVK